MKKSIDISPMMDEGDPSSIGGTNSADKLCDALGMPFILSQPRSVYPHGWGVKCLDAKIVIATWYIKTYDHNGKYTVLPFDIIEGDSPLILGLDVKKFANILNLSKPPLLKLKRPSDFTEMNFVTYVKDDSSGSPRTWVEIIPHIKTKVQSLMAVKSKRDAHAFSDDMQRLLFSARYNDDELQAICKNVYR